MKVSRLETVIVASMGLMPFCNLHRFAPIPGFWGQWLAVVLFAAWVLYRRWTRNPQVSMPIPGLSAGFFALCVVLLIQASTGLAEYRSATSLAAFELLLAGCVAVEAARARAEGTSATMLEVFAWATIGALMLNAFSALGARLDWPLPAPYDRWLARSFSGREVGLMGQSNHLGMLAVLAVAGAVYLRERARIPKWLFVLVIILGGLVVAASASRTALAVAIFLTAARVAMYAARRRNRAAFLGLSANKSLMATGICLFFAIQFAWPIVESHVNPSATPMLRTSVAGRGELLRDAFDMAIHHPLLGVGFGNFASIRLFGLDGSLRNPNADNAHNLFAQAAAEWGILGLLPVLATVALLFVALARVSREREWKPETLFAASWVLGLLGHSMVEFPLWFAHLLMPFAWMLGFVPNADFWPKNSTARPVNRALVAALGAILLVLCVGGAWDYRRSERLATSVLEDVRSSSRSTALIKTADAMDIANLTLYPMSADLMQSRAIEIDPLLASTKLDLATKALRALPHPETMTRYIAFLIFNGRQEEADAFLQMVARRSPSSAQETLVGLRQIAATRPLVASFLAAVAPATEAAIAAAQLPPTAAARP